MAAAPHMSILKDKEGQAPKGENAICLFLDTLRLNVFGLKNI